MTTKLRAVPDVTTKAPSALPPSVPQFLTVTEVAAMLRLTPKAIYKMVHERRIPFRKAGTQLLFNPKEIDEWTKAGAERS
jgi:excisionase family DNA binding protein